MDGIRRWWDQPDHFRWLSGYLAYRNLRGFTRKMMGSIVVVLGAVPLLLMFSRAGATTSAGRAVSATVVISCAVMATAWFTRWPNRCQSVAFCTVSGLCITAACLVLPDPLTGLIGCIAFAALAGYVGFFHSGRHLAAVLALAAVVAVDSAVEIALAGDVFLAVGATLAVAVGVLAVPFSAQVLVHLLGNDALQSHSDPLTGLRNRRGFYRSVREMITTAADDGLPYLTVLMVDLDRFKAINDTRGHAVGDQLLVDVGACLRTATGGHAVVARVGGEEFLVAEAVAHDGGNDELAERLRLAVADLPWSVTASVGVACAVVGGTDGATRSIVEDIVAAADAAMYAAKRDGGNRYHRATTVH